MNTTCAPVCETCEQLSYEYRCPVDKNAPKVLNHPGDLDKIFERILQEEQFQQFAPSILSSPNNARKGPWVVQLDSFATAEECERLIQLGGQIGYAPSFTLGTTHPNGTSEHVVENTIRTSTSAWLTYEQCEKESLVSTMLDRVETLLDVPKNNMEHVRLLRYEESQLYGQHHDYLSHHKNQPQVGYIHENLLHCSMGQCLTYCCFRRRQGVRILTMFLHLNDVEDGGETIFPNLGITVKPKKGRAVLWPSTLNEAPDIKDFRTEHEALAVKRGIKYASNVWIHQGNYRQARDNGCV
jgi:prolyl 4-hydroxylase